MTKPTILHVHPAKTQISLGIHPVWSEYSLSAWRKIGSLAAKDPIATHWMHSEDSNQTGRMPRLIWVFAGCTVGFVMRQLKFLLDVILPFVPLYNLCLIAFGVSRLMHYVSIL